MWTPLWNPPSRKAQFFDTSHSKNLLFQTLNGTAGLPNSVKSPDGITNSENKIATKSTWQSWLCFTSLKGTYQEIDNLREHFTFLTREDERASAVWSTPLILNDYTFMRELRHSSSIWPFICRVCSFRFLPTSNSRRTIQVRLRMRVKFRLVRGPGSQSLAQSYWWCH